MMQRAAVDEADAQTPQQQMTGVWDLMTAVVDRQMCDEEQQLERVKLRLIA